MSKINEKILDSISKIIDENEHLILHNYNEKADQILFRKELINKFFHQIESYTQDSKDAKVLLKYAIKKLLNLNESDVIVSKNGHFFIKKFDASKKKDSSVERRFDGIDEEELKSFYDEFFNEKENKKIFALIAKEFVAYLDENKITNEKYEKAVFKDIQSMICKHLTAKYDNTKEFFFGFSGYYFRIHFTDVFEQVADCILNEIANVNEHITEFMKYYAINIAVIDGKKYEIPSIETKDGANWTPPSILSISKKYFKLQEYRESLLNDIATLKKENAKLMIDGISPIQHQKNTESSLTKLEEELSQTKRELEINSDSLAMSKVDEEKKELRETVGKLKNAVQELENKIEQVEKKKIKDSVIEAYQKAQRELDFKMRDLKNKEKTGIQNATLYNSVRASLVKALISKKKLLKAEY